MALISELQSDIRSSFGFLYEKRYRVVHMVGFFAVVSLLSVVFSDLVPIVIAALFVLPLRVLMRTGTPFPEEDYQRFSPLLANLMDYRFLGTTAVFLIPVLGSIYRETVVTWAELGTLAFTIIATSVGVFTWSEGLYEKNYYFDRWHVIERVVFVSLGLLSLLSPVFLPLFLLLFKVTIDQFQYPGIGSFNTTHSRLPHTMILILSAFTFASMIFHIEPHMVHFLLFCGYASHYFHPGVEKLRNGPLYYIRHNNPFCMFINAYQIGWLSSLEERTVLRIGQLSERINPIINVIVLLIEIGTMFVLFSANLAIIIVTFTISLHALIFATTGDSFWKWVVVDGGIIVGLLLTSSQQLLVFTDPQWFLLSLLFVSLSFAWMNPASMGWLDVPYVELFKFETDLKDGSKNVPIHSNVFRPYDSITTQGITGTLIFLGEHPRITYSHGAIIEERNKDLHRTIRDAAMKDPPDEATKAELVERDGLDMYDPSKVAQFEEFIRQFVGTKRSSPAKLLRYVSSPREFYSFGLSDKKATQLLEEMECIRIYRIDGLWTNEGFEELEREEVLSVQV